MKTVFESKVDTWFYLLALGIPVLTLLAMVGLIRPITLLNGSIFLFFALIAVGLPLWLLFSTRYTVTADELVVRSGPIRIRVPRADIQSITPTRSLLSSPALSMDRLEVRYGRWQTVLVSPKDKQGFLAALGFDNAGN